MLVAAREPFLTNSRDFCTIEIEKALVFCQSFLFFREGEGD